MSEEEHEPLQMTFVVGSPSELDIQLICIMERQILNGDTYKKNVLRACKYIAEKYEGEL